MTGTPVAQLVDATLGYRNHPVLTDVNLILGAGELIGVIGASGAGKSTLLGALSGADVQLGGAVTVAGADPRWSTSPVGLVPQLDDGTPTRLSVEELVALGRPRAGLFTSRAERSAVSARLAQLGLAPNRRRRIDELSGGQRQRVAIARALMGSSTLVLCDEPTSGADPALTVDIVDVLAGVARAGTTVIIATHDLAVVVPRLDRLVGIGNGTICYDGTPDGFDVDAQADVYGTPVTRKAE